MKVGFSHPQLYEGQTADHAVGSDVLGVLVNLLSLEAGHTLGVLLTLAMVCEAGVRGLSADTDTHAGLVRNQSSHTHSCYKSLNLLYVYYKMVFYFYDDVSNWFVKID